MAMNDVVRVSAPNATKAEQERRRKIADEERDRNRPRLERANPNAVSAAGDRTMLEQLRSGEGGQGDPDTNLQAAPVVGLSALGGSVAAAAGTAIGVLKLKKDLEKMGVEAFADPGNLLTLMPMLGMIKPASAQQLAKFNHILGDADYAKLPRAQKLYLKRQTGVEMLDGVPVHETMRDPKFKDVFMRAVKSRLDRMSLVQRGARAELADIVNYGDTETVPLRTLVRDAIARRRTEAARTSNHLHDEVADLLENIIEKKRSHLRQPGRTFRTDEVSVIPHDSKYGGRVRLGDIMEPVDDELLTDWVNEYRGLTDARVMSDPLLAVPGKGGAHELVGGLHKSMPIDVAGDIVLSDAARSPNTAEQVVRRMRKTALHEIQHEYDDMNGLDVGSRSIPYLLRPGERRAFAVGHRADMAPEERMESLLEESVPRQASKGGNALGESKSSAVPKGHNPALDGYQGPRIMINPSTFRNGKDALCVAWNEAIRVFMEANDYEPQSEPTEKQRKFFADTPYADDELQLRRTILARICVFDTSVKDPTDDQLSESAQVLRAIIDSGFAKTDDEIEKCERLARAIEAAVGAEPVEPREEPLQQAPLQPNEETQAADKAGETEEEALKRLAGGDTGSTVQEDTSTLEEREKFLEDRGMDKSLAETGSMDTLVKMHEQETQGTVGAEQLQAEQTAASQQGQPQVGQAGAQPQQEQQAAVAQPRQETLAPGLSRSGSRNNILEYEGRRISQREFNRIQAKFQEGGPQQPTGIGGRTLTAGEAAWQAKRRASTEAWMQRTGQNAVADAGLPEAQPNAEPREEMDGLGGEGGGLVKSGSRGNILTYKGRRTTDREARRLGLI